MYLYAVLSTLFLTRRMWPSTKPWKTAPDHHPTCTKSYYCHYAWSQPCVQLLSTIHEALETQLLPEAVWNSVVNEAMFTSALLWAAYSTASRCYHFTIMTQTDYQSGSTRTELFTERLMVNVASHNCAMVKVTAAFSMIYSRHNDWLLDFIHLLPLSSSQ